MSRWLLVVGVAALVGAAAVALGARAPRDVGADLTTPSTTASTRPTSTPTEASAPTPAPTPVPTPSADPTHQATVPTRSARLADAPVTAVAPPARLSVPAIGVDAPIVPVGVEADGQMTVPADVGVAGWYRHGPTPGATGSAVLAGHVDSRTQGRGAFFDLDRVGVGDEVVVTDAAGDLQRWVVTGRQTIAKAELPLEEVFRRDGPARLLLITCGGSFDERSRHYRSNVVVTAEPRP